MSQCRLEERNRDPIAEMEEGGKPEPLGRAWQVARRWEPWKYLEQEKAATWPFPSLPHRGREHLREVKPLTQGHTDIM